MRRMILASSLAAVLALTGAPMLAHANEKAPKTTHVKSVEKNHKAGLRGEYATMAKELQLSADQQAKLADLAKQQAQANKDWEQKNKDQLKKALADRHSTDPAVKKQAGEDYQKLSIERRDMQADFQKQALAILTPDQRTQWEGYKLTEAVKNNLKRHKITLTDDQQAKIKSLAADDLKNVDLNDSAALKKAHAELNKQVNDTVLTDDQKQQLPKPKVAPKAASKKADKGN